MYVLTLDPDWFGGPVVKGTLAEVPRSKRRNPRVYFQLTWYRPVTETWSSRPVPALLPDPYPGLPALRDQWDALHWQLVYRQTALVPEQSRALRSTGLNLSLGTQGGWSTPDALAIRLDADQPLMGRTLGAWMKGRAESGFPLVHAVEPVWLL